MGIPAVSSLANMEYMLYGGMSGGNVNCPSYLNGYRGTSTNYYSPYQMPYYNPSFGVTPYQNAYSGSQGADPFTSSSSTNRSSGYGTGISQEDLDILAKYYLDGMAPSESLMGAAAGGAAFALVNNPRIIAHPWNSWKATTATNKMFSGVKKEGSELYKLWRGAPTHDIMSEAFANTHKLEARMNSKLGLFRSSLKDSPQAKTLLSEMEALLKNPNPNLQDIATKSEEIKRLTKGYDGYISKGMKKIGLDKVGKAIKNFFEKVPLIGELIKGGPKLTASEAAAKNIAEAANNGLLKRIKHGCGAGGALFFMAIEFIMGIGKISEAFSKDASTGWTQIGQTAIKGLGSAIGWGVGEALGAAAGAKLGALLGTAIAPGLGTAIGAAAGLVGGSIGCWLTGKITNAVVGQDIADKVKVAKMKQTPQGQTELLQLTLQQAQNDKKLDPKTAQALQHVYNAIS